MSSEFWVIYDPTEKTQSDKLSFEQAQFSLMKMKTKDINNFLIWKSGWPKWLKLNEFLLSGDSPFMKTFLDKAATDGSTDLQQLNPLKMKPVDLETAQNIQALFSNVQLEEVELSDLPNSEESQFDGDQLSSDSPKTKSNLNFKSLGKSKNNKNNKNNLELLLIHPKGVMLRTIAKDISLSGTFCEKIVPDEFHHSIFDLVIINNFIPDIQYNRLTLKAQVATVNSSVYLQYVNATDEQKESLRAILDYYVRATKKPRISESD